MVRKTKTLQLSTEEAIERLETFGWILVSVQDDAVQGVAGRTRPVTAGAVRRGNWVGAFVLAPVFEDGDIIDRRVVRDTETAVALRFAKSTLWVSAKDGDCALRELSCVVPLLGAGFEYDKYSGTEQKQGFNRCVERLRARRWKIDRAVSSWWDFYWDVTGRRRSERLNFSGGWGPGDNVRDSHGWPSVPSVDDDGEARCAGESWTCSLSVDSLTPAIALIDAIAGRACAELVERESFLV